MPRRAFTTIITFRCGCGCGFYPAPTRSKIASVRTCNPSFDTTLPRFDLMAQLERAPEGLKMSELSQRMMVTGGNVTGITDGLEKEGLVVREVDAADRRVFRVKLTPEGQRQFQRMAAEHEQWVVDLFGGLTQKQKKQLVDLLGELKIAHLRRPRAAVEHA